MKSCNYFIAVFIVIITTGFSINAQLYSNNLNNAFEGIKTDFQKIIKRPLIKYEKKSFTAFLAPSLSLRLAYTVPFSISSSYYVDHLGFFCKKELQIQKAIKFPISVRLGSLDYVNFLESKPNAVYIHK